jgi:phosphomevalonate kinase
MQFKEGNPEKYWTLIEDLSELSENGCQAFKSAQTSNFLEICDHYLYTLMQLGESSGTEIISDIHKKIAKIVQLAGGVYKPSGAGGGDIGIALLDSPTGEQNLKDALLYSGFEILNLNLENSGAGVKRISQK